MQEKLKHMEVFEYYYNLGEKRNFSKISRQFVVSVQSVKLWSGNFNWQERIHLRDIEVAKQLRKKTIYDTVKIKAARLKEISNLQKILTRAIKTAVKSLRDNKLKVKSPADLNFITLSKERITKLEQLLLGEDTARETLDIYIEIEGEDEDKDE